jgi:heme-degrading monooxygenase HmoA
VRWAARIADLARKMLGYVSHKDFIAEDGERVTIVEFESEDAQLAWTTHIDHLEAQRKGRKIFIWSSRFKFAASGAPAHSASRRRRAQTEADVAA